MVAEHCQLAKPVHGAPGSHPVPVLLSGGFAPGKAARALPLPRARFGTQYRSPEATSRSSSSRPVIRISSPQHSPTPSKNASRSGIFQNANVYNIQSQLAASL